MQWFLKCIKQHYFDFKGRAGRQEFWMFNLFNLIISIVLVVVAVLMSTVLGEGALMLVNIYSLAVMLPSLAVMVRRLHDIGKSGWMILISLVPLVGGVYLLYLLMQKSDGPNSYGGQAVAV